MPIVATFTCPATLTTIKRPIEDEHGYSFEAPDEEVTFPPGWGDLTVRTMVKNPEWIAINERRDAERVTYDKMIADPDVPQEAKDQAVANFDVELDRLFPVLDNEYVWRVETWSPLAPSALDAVHKALTAAQLPDLPAAE